MSHAIRCLDAFTSRDSQQHVLSADRPPGIEITIGSTCDYISRRAAIIITTLMIVVGGILATAANAYSIIGMFWMLTVARGIVGFGIEGEYPACSTSASEAANEHRLKQRGPIFILVTNLPLSLSGPAAVIIFLIVLLAAGSNHLFTVWRTCMGIGAEQQALSARSDQEASAISSGVKHYWKSLFGTAGAWFLYDFVTFPKGIFSGEIISSVVSSSDAIRSTGEWQLLLDILSIPGVLIGAYLCNKIGRKYTMMLGFSGYLVFGLIVGLSHDNIAKIVPLFVIFYGLMQNSGNLGPGDMLGLLSSESYATAVRGTCYGFSAAFGKTGAAVGTEASTPIQTHLGKRWTFIVAAISGVAGILVTYFSVPNVTGEDLATSDERFRLYLVSKGWNGEMGEEDLKALADQGIPENVDAKAD